MLEDVSRGVLEADGLLICSSEGPVIKLLSTNPCEQIIYSTRGRHTVTTRSESQNEMDMIETSGDSRPEV